MKSSPATPPAIRPRAAVVMANCGEIASERWLASNTRRIVEPAMPASSGQKNSSHVRYRFRNVLPSQGYRHASHRQEEEQDRDDCPPGHGNLAADLCHTLKRR